MYILFGLYAIATTIVLAFPHYYTSELLISFLPYHGLILIFLLVASCFIYFRKSFKYFQLIVIVFGTIVTGYTNYQRMSFYQNQPYEIQEQFDETKEKVGLSFYFANILKDNTNYQEIEKKITDLHPDVILLVEYTQDHHDHIGPFLSENYPYINRIPGTQEIVGNVIFSKYPLEDFAPKIYQGPRRYGYVAINFEDKDYYFYLVHTSAPVNYHYYENRSSQFELFGANFVEQDLKRLPDDRVVLVGDFNVSPRSPTFKEFNKLIHTATSQMTHMSKFTGLRFSRGLTHRGEDKYPRLKSIIRSHIDHLWISKTTTLYQLEKIELSGSDHDGLFARIY